MNIRPLDERVLVLPLQVEEKTIGGIIIPNTDDNNVLHGKVVAIGRGVDMAISVGATVLYAKNVGIEFTHENEKCIIINQRDLLAVITE
jgi:chaperonin GroES